MNLLYNVFCTLVTILPPPSVLTAIFQVNLD